MLSILHMLELKDNHEPSYSLKLVNFQDQDMRNITSITAVPPSKEP